MNFVEMKLDGGGRVSVNPDHISHLEQRIGADVTLMFLNTDNMPTVIDEHFDSVVPRLNEAMEDETATAVHNGDCEHIENSKALIREIRRLQWAFGCAALAFFILLLVIVGRSH